MAERLLKYGLRDDVLVSVENVVSGLKCGCVCPSCGAPLVAKKGDKREHHFAHHGDTECSTACESALHLMAKQILASRRELFIPDEAGGDGGAVREYTAVQLESREYPNIIPDVVMKNGDEILCVEILVTHAVDEEKLKKLTEAKLPTVEIDLGDLIDNYDETVVTEALYSGNHTVWIYNETLAAKRRRQKVIDEVCDYLPCVSQGYYREYYDCLEQKKRVSFESCHDCWQFNHNSSREMLPPLPCSYRERELLKMNPEDCRNIERKDGVVLSIEVLIDGEWQRWTGNAASILAPGQSKADAGKPLLELWKPEYSAMVVRNLADKQEMIINGKDGKMYRNQNNRIVGRYRNRGYDGKYTNSQKYYAVWGAEKPIWELVISFKRNS